MVSRSQKPAVRRAWLLVSVVSNLGMLAYFKYVNFFAETVTEIATRFGVSLTWVDLNVLLPIGISFYTFESLSYTIDVYRGLIPAQQSWYRFAFFVAYFPHLIAGPIMRAGQFIPQLDVRPRLDVQALEEGLMRIGRGLFKKIVLADYLAVFADRAFNAPSQVDMISTWLGVYAFTFQIYFDFSGYTDLAVGSARLMGFQLPENFRNPYVALSATDFWRRWHITLSFWLRDYLYIPLGGGRMATRWGVCRNLLITMAVAGLWHGAALHFVFWGFLYGVLLSVERIVDFAKKVEQLSASSVWLRGILALVAFHGFALLWVPFRGLTAEHILTLFRQLFSFQAPAHLTLGMVVVLVITYAAWLTQFISEHVDLRERFLSLPVYAKGFCYAASVMCILIFSSGLPQPFIYFRF
jgi:D-alanyl-lipoteichoic acid acyltransferase DltB (MBOAT superfamily)